MRVLLSQQCMETSAAVTTNIDFNENFVRDFGRSALFLISLVVPIDTIGDIVTGLNVHSYAERTHMAIISTSSHEESSTLAASKLSSIVQQNTLTSSRGEKFPNRDMYVMGDWMGNFIIANYKNSV
eukprot:IDg4222t1